MTVEYRKLTDWNPRKGDVFENEYGSLCRVVSDTHARFDVWGDEEPAPIEWFQSNFRLVARAGDHTDRCNVTSAEEQAGNDLHRTLREVAADLLGAATKLDHTASQMERDQAAKPERTTQTFIGSARHGFSHLWERHEDTHYLTLPLIDGKLPAGEYRNANGDVITVEVLK